MILTPPQAMLLTKAEEPFDDPRYVFEPKIDGHRLLLVKDEVSVRLWTRHENEVTQKYPELHEPPLNCSSCILDGEIAYVDPSTGMIDFEAVMERFRMTKLSMIQEDGMLRLPVQYFIFDVLEVDKLEQAHIIGDLQDRAKAIQDIKEMYYIHFTRTCEVLIVSLENWDYMISK